MECSSGAVVVIADSARLLWLAMLQLSALHHLSGNLVHKHYTMDRCCTKLRTNQSLCHLRRRREQEQRMVHGIVLSYNQESDLHQV